MRRTINRLRILGSGFTEEEYRLYRFDTLSDPADAMRFLSHRLNHRVYRPAVNRGHQQHVLEDKLIAHLFFEGLGIRVPKTYGVFHPRFGLTTDGRPLTTPAQLAEALAPDLPCQLVFKPRGGRKGGHISLVEVGPDGAGAIRVSGPEGAVPLDRFLSSLPADAFDAYEGCYHGWLIQARIRQHEALDRLNPHTVNSVRVVTFIDARDQVQIHHAVLRLGRRGGTADNWDKGGLSVAVDGATGRLGRGVFKPSHGGAWTSEHPDTGAAFEGAYLPDWPAVRTLCQQAAAALSGTRSVGWDVALTPAGPTLIEGNATWGLPVVQVHTRGYLTDAVRAELAAFGARFPETPRALPAALLALARDQWNRSRAPGRLRWLKQIALGRRP